MSLSPQQKQAVETESKKVLVLAGAGSGKTRVLTERIAHLVENKKVSPSEILSFTFTRKASGEMRKRLEDRIGSQAHGVTMGTMHKIALVMIQRFGEMIGLKPGKITVYSQWEENYLLKEIAIELGYHTGKTYKGIKKRDVERLFNNYYQKGWYPHKYNPGYDLFIVFEQRCKENNALTYGSLLTSFKFLIPKIAKLLHYKYIFVDEVQDLDPFQWQIVNMLCGVFNAALFVVGDIDQSVYGFRGAYPKYLIEHEKEFDIYRLETNYRSSIPIVEAANKLILHNKGRLEKTMVANDNPYPFSPVLRHSNMDSERIISLVELVLSTHFIIKDIAIIGRNHFLLESLSEKLTDAGIKNDYAGKKTALTNSEEFRRFHAFLKLIVNPYDNFSFLLIRELMGLNRSEYMGIREKAVVEGKSHFQIFFDENADDYEKDFFVNTNLTHLVMNIVDNYNIEDEIISFIGYWIMDNPNGTIKDYLEWLATYDVQDEITEENEGVQLMTIHASKGLEWPVVIVAGCNDGILPGRRAFKDVEEMEAERRLSYVAWTRAKHQLILTSRPTHNDDGELTSPVSRFIGESGL